MIGPQGERFPISALSSDYSVQLSPADGADVTPTIENM